MDCIPKVPLGRGDVGSWAFSAMPSDPLSVIAIMKKGKKTYKNRDLYCVEEKLVRFKGKHMKKGTIGRIKMILCVNQGQKNTHTGLIWCGARLASNMAGLLACVVLV